MNKFKKGNALNTNYLMKYILLSILSTNILISCNNDKNHDVVTESDTEVIIKDILVKIDLALKKDTT